MKTGIGEQINIASVEKAQWAIGVVIDSMKLNWNEALSAALWYGVIAAKQIGFERDFFILRASEMWDALNVEKKTNAEA